MTEKTKEELNDELEALHSWIMAIEELLIWKGIVTLDELNSSIQKAQQECKKAKEHWKKIHTGNI